MNTLTASTYSRYTQESQCRDLHDTAVCVCVAVILAACPSRVAVKEASKGPLPP